MAIFYNDEQKLANDPATIEFTKALRKFSKAIPFRELSIEHIVSSDHMIKDIKREDYFEMTIEQGSGELYFTMTVDLEEHAPIYLTKCEYDLLATNDKKDGRRFGDFQTYINMKNAGWFRDISLDMKIEDILEDCVVVVSD